MQPSPFETYIAAWIRRGEQRSVQLALLRQKAQRVGREVARALGRNDSTILRIWGFGSTFESDRPYRENSDIDLAMEGGDWVRGFWLIQQRPEPIDLIELADQSMAFQEAVRERGVVLYKNT